MKKVLVASPATSALAAAIGVTVMAANSNIGGVALLSLNFAKICY